jgi:hypothetical protein
VSFAAGLVWWRVFIKTNPRPALSHGGAIVQ